MKIDVRLAWQNDKQNSNQVCSFSGLLSKLHMMLLKSPNTISSRH